MKNPINKSNLRRPLKSILLILLLLITTYTFISSITQFVIVNRETNRIGAYYKSIGAIEPLDEDEPINQAVKMISNDEMIASEDIRRRTLGTIEGMPSPPVINFESLDYDQFDNYKLFMGDCIFIATVTEVFQAPSAESIYDGLGINMRVVERIAGYPDYIRERTNIGIAVPSRSLVTDEPIEYINNNVIDDLLVLEPGEPYLFRTYFAEDVANHFSILKPLYTDGPLYEKIEDGQMDWDDPKWNILKEDIDVLNENIQTYEVYTTKDMTEIPFFQESMKSHYIKRGRPIDKDDFINENKVCVIDEEIADVRDISVGDKLEIKMKDTEKGHSFLVTDQDRKEWKNYKTTEAMEFEVVGISTSPMGLDSRREIYIPESVLPQDFGSYDNLDLGEDYIFPLMYSFTLKNSSDESSFIEKYEDPLQNAGFNLYFVENNAESFWNSADSIKGSSQISFIIYTIILLLTQIIIVYTYIDGHKLNYAIERALGISTKKSGIHLGVPIVLSGCIASIVGGFLGYQNAVEQSSELLMDISEISQQTANTSLDVKYFFFFIVLAMVTFIAILLVDIHRLKKASIINLINNHGAKKKKKKAEEQNLDAVLDNTELKAISYDTLEDTENLEKGGNKSVLRKYAFNHVIRTKVTSFLMIMLAGIFVFSLLWMNYLMIRNVVLIDKAYEKTEVTGEIIRQKSGLSVEEDQGLISSSHVDHLFQTNLVKDYTGVIHMHYTAFYIEDEGVETLYEIDNQGTDQYLKDNAIPVIGSNKLFSDQRDIIQLSELQFMDGYTEEDLQRNYVVEQDDSLEPIVVDEHGNSEIPILVSEKAMSDYQLELGDKIALQEESKNLIKAYATIVGTFEEHGVGRVVEGFTLGLQDESLFIYPESALKAIERSNIQYTLLEFEFKSEKNKELLERKEEILGLVANNEYDGISHELVLWDGELINVVEPLEKNLSLLEILYPITLIVAIIIAGILSFIMILRRTLDVAILRILGVKAKDVKKSLFMENIILVLIGVLISVVTIQLITIDSYSISLSSYGMVIGGYLLGTIVGLILSIRKVTNKKPLAMLQVKE